jgi:hypothetical protein
MTTRHHMICSACGSEDVQADAFAQWNRKAQQWELVTTFDKGSVCNDCDGECSIDEVPEGTAFASVERDDDEEDKFRAVVRCGDDIIQRDDGLYETSADAHAAAETLLDATT